jgi:hypothetical protein
MLVPVIGLIQSKLAIVVTCTMYVHIEVRRYYACIMSVGNLIVLLTIASITCMHFKPVPFCQKTRSGD